MLNSILVKPLTLPVLLICLGTAAVLGILTAVIFTWRSRHTASFALTLALVPMAVGFIIMLVNGNIGTGVAVAGTFALVRFRSIEGTGREIAALLVETALGLACGMGYIGVAVLFFLLTAVLTLALTGVNFCGVRKTDRILRVTLPEDVDYNGLLDDIFERYHVRATVERVRSVSMGTLFEVTYAVTLPDSSIPKAMLDEIRTRNMNLNLVICSPDEDGRL